ncbi:uncharacterized protein LOC143021811 [Oratosquilla oratoria]|uniref:uncharacterized protein LOC143021811 n=1 Tax=Oratosquilla oratoria TaxID=337810 RepID=UPI003F75EF07
MVMEDSSLKNTSSGDVLGDTVGAIQSNNTGDETITTKYNSYVCALENVDTTKDFSDGGIEDSNSTNVFEQNVRNDTNSLTMHSEDFKKACFSLLYEKDHTKDTSEKHRIDHSVLALCASDSVNDRREGNSGDSMNLASGEKMLTGDGLSIRGKDCKVECVSQSGGSVSVESHVNHEIQKGDTVYSDGNMDRCDRTSDRLASIDRNETADLDPVTSQTRSRDELNSQNKLKDMIINPIYSTNQFDSNISSQREKTTAETRQCAQYGRIAVDVENQSCVQVPAVEDSSGRDVAETCWDSQGVRKSNEMDPQATIPGDNVCGRLPVTGNLSLFNDQNDDHMLIRDVYLQLGLTPTVGEQKGDDTSGINTCDLPNQKPDAPVATSAPSYPSRDCCSRQGNEESQPSGRQTSRYLNLGFLQRDVFLDAACKHMSEVRIQAMFPSKGYGSESTTSYDHRFGQRRFNVLDVELPSLIPIPDDPSRVSVNQEIDTLRREFNTPGRSRKFSRSMSKMAACQPVLATNQPTEGTRSIGQMRGIPCSSMTVHTPLKNRTPNTRAVKGFTSRTPQTVQQAAQSLSSNEQEKNIENYDSPPRHSFYVYNLSTEGVLLPIPPYTSRPQKSKSKESSQSLPYDKASQFDTETPSSSLQSQVTSIPGTSSKQRYKFRRLPSSASSSSTDANIHRTSPTSTRVTEVSMTPAILPIQTHLASPVPVTKNPSSHLSHQCSSQSHASTPVTSRAVPVNEPNQNSVTVDQKGKSPECIVISSDSSPEIVPVNDGNLSAVTGKPSLDSASCFSREYSKGILNESVLNSSNKNDNISDVDVGCAGEAQSVMTSPVLKTHNPIRWKAGKNSNIVQDRSELANKLIDSVDCSQPQLANLQNGDEISTRTSKNRLSVAVIDDRAVTDNSKDDGDISNLTSEHDTVTSFVSAAADIVETERKTICKTYSFTKCKPGNDSTVVDDRSKFGNEPMNDADSNHSQVSKDQNEIEIKTQTSKSPMPISSDIDKLAVNISEDDDDDGDDDDDACTVIFELDTVTSLVSAAGNTAEIESKTVLNTYNSMRCKAGENTDVVKDRNKSISEPTDDVDLSQSRFSNAQIEVEITEKSSESAICASRDTDKIELSSDDDASTVVFELDTAVSVEPAAEDIAKSENGSMQTPVLHQLVKDKPRSQSTEISERLELPPSSNITSVSSLQDENPSVHPTNPRHNYAVDLNSSYLYTSNFNAVVAASSNDACDIKQQSLLVGDIGKQVKSNEKLPQTSHIQTSFQTLACDSNNRSDVLEHILVVRESSYFEINVSSDMSLSHQVIESRELLTMHNTERCSELSSQEKQVISTGTEKMISSVDTLGMQMKPEDSQFITNAIEAQKEKAQGIMSAGVDLGKNQRKQVLMKPAMGPVVSETQTWGELRSCHIASESLSETQIKETSESHEKPGFLDVQKELKTEVINLGYEICDLARIERTPILSSKSLTTTESDVHGHSHYSTTTQEYGTGKDTDILDPEIRNAGINQNKQLRLIATRTKHTICSSQERSDKNETVNTMGKKRNFESEACKSVHEIGDFSEKDAVITEAVKRRRGCQNPILSTRIVEKSDFPEETRRNQGTVSMKIVAEGSQFLTDSCKMISSKEPISVKLYKMTDIKNSCGHGNYEVDDDIDVPSDTVITLQEEKKYIPEAEKAMSNENDGAVVGTMSLSEKRNKITEGTADAFNMPNVLPKMAVCINNHTLPEERKAERDHLGEIHEESVNVALEQDICDNGLTITTYSPENLDCMAGNKAVSLVREGLPHSNSVPGKIGFGDRDRNIGIIMSEGLSVSSKSPKKKYNSFSTDNMNKDREVLPFAKASPGKGWISLEERPINMQVDINDDITQARETQTETKVLMSSRCSPIEDANRENASYSSIQRGELMAGENYPQKVITTATSVINYSPQGEKLKSPMREHCIQKETSLAYTSELQQVKIVPEKEVSLPFVKNGDSEDKNDQILEEAIPSNIITHPNEVTNPVNNHCKPQEQVGKRDCMEVETAYDLNSLENHSMNCSAQPLLNIQDSREGLTPLTDKGVGRNSIGKSSMRKLMEKIESKKPFEKSRIQIGNEKQNKTTSRFYEHKPIVTSSPLIRNKDSITDDTANRMMTHVKKTDGNSGEEEQGKEKLPLNMTQEIMSWDGKQVLCSANACPNPVMTEEVNGNKNISPGSEIISSEISTMSKSITKNEDSIIGEGNNESEYITTADRDTKSDKSVIEDVRSMKSIASTRESRSEDPLGSVNSILPGGISKGKKSITNDLILGSEQSDIRCGPTVNEDLVIRENMGKSEMSSSNTETSINKCSTVEILLENEPQAACNSYEGPCESPGKTANVPKGKENRIVEQLYPTEERGEMLKKENSYDENQSKGPQELNEDGVLLRETNGVTDNELLSERTVITTESKKVAEEDNSFLAKEVDGISRYESVPVETGGMPEDELPPKEIDMTEEGKLFRNNEGSDEGKEQLAKISDIFGQAKKCEIVEGLKALAERIGAMNEDECPSLGRVSEMLLNNVLTVGKTESGSKDSYVEKPRKAFTKETDSELANKTELGILISEEGERQTALDRQKQTALEPKVPQQDSASKGKNQTIEEFPGKPYWISTSKCATKDIIAEAQAMVARYFVERHREEVKIATESKLLSAQEHHKEGEPQGSEQEAVASKYFTEGSKNEVSSVNDVKSCSEKESCKQVKQQDSQHVEQETKASRTSIHELSSGSDVKSLSLEERGNQVETQEYHVAEQEVSREKDDREKLTPNVKPETRLLAEPKVCKSIYEEDLQRNTTHDIKTATMEDFIQRVSLKLAQFNKILTLKPCPTRGLDKQDYIPINTYFQRQTAQLASQIQNREHSLGNTKNIQKCENHIEPTDKEPRHYVPEAVNEVNRNETLAFVNEPNRNELSVSGKEQHRHQLSASDNEINRSESSVAAKEQHRNDASGTAREQHKDGVSVTTKGNISEASPTPREAERESSNSTVNYAEIKTQSMVLATAEPASETLHENSDSKGSKLEGESTLKADSRSTETTAIEEKDKTSGQAKSRKKYVNQRRRGDKHWRLFVELDDVHKNILLKLQKAAAWLIGRLVEERVIPKTRSLVTLHPELTRCSLKTLMEESKSTDISEKRNQKAYLKYALVLRLHGLVKTSNLLIHCGIASAVHALRRFHSTHRKLVQEHYRQLLSDLSDVSLEGAVHPKVEVLKDILKRMMKCEDFRDGELKVMVVAPRQMETVGRQLQALKLSIGSVEPLTRSHYAHILTLLETNHIIVWSGVGKAEYVPWAQFGLIVEWEDFGCEGSSSLGSGGDSLATNWKNHCARQNVRVLTLSTKISEDLHETHKGTSAEPEEQLEKTSDSKNEAAATEAHNKKDSEPEVECFQKKELEELKLIASEAVVDQVELHCALTSIYNIHLVERKTRVVQEDGAWPQCWADVVVDERVGVVLQDLRKIGVRRGNEDNDDDGDRSSSLSGLFQRLRLLSFQYTHCYVILYSNVSYSQGYPFSRNVIRAMNRLVSYCILRRTPEFQVSLLLVKSLGQAAAAIRAVAEAARSSSPVWHEDEWTSRPWLSPYMSNHEKFLTSFPCLNPLSSQIMLTALSLRKLLTLELDELLEALPWIPSHIVKMFYESVNKGQKRKADIEESAPTPSKKTVFENSLPTPKKTPTFHLNPRPSCAAPSEPNLLDFSVPDYTYSGFSFPITESAGCSSAFDGSTLDGHTFNEPEFHQDPSGPPAISAQPYSKDHTPSISVEGNAFNFSFHREINPTTILPSASMIQPSLFVNNQSYYGVDHSRPYEEFSGFPPQVGSELMEYSDTTNCLNYADNPVLHIIPENVSIGHNWPVTVSPYFGNQAEPGDSNPTLGSINNEVQVNFLQETQVCSSLYPPTIDPLPNIRHFGDCFEENIVREQTYDRGQFVPFEGSSNTENFVLYHTDLSANNV